VGVPYTVAEKASEISRSHGLHRKQRKGLSSYEEKDEVWAVFDRDTHPRFDEAIALCKKHGVEVARSNPCFEVWLILHIRDYQKPDNCATVQALLATLCPEYDPNKGKVPDCDALLKSLDQAEQRAHAQLDRRSAEGTPFGNPSTTVFLLTKAIRAAVAKRTKRRR
jgi:hypothetical protein